MVQIENISSPIGNLGIFTQKDFYCKSQQSNLPQSHTFDARLFLAYEYIYELFSQVYGDLGKPYFGDGSTYRIEGDPSFKNKRTGRLSFHSLGRAADGNWSRARQSSGFTLEEEIVLIIGHDLKIKGKIYKALTDIGVNGFGTYYQQGEGTFLHLDTRNNFTHFKKLPPLQLPKARELHEQFFIKINAQNGEPSTDNNNDSEQNPIPEQEIPKEEAIVTIIEESKPVLVVREGYERVYNLFKSEEEDPYSKSYKNFRIIAIGGLALALISLIIFLIIRFNK